MASINYPCKKCLNECDEDHDCICCDICDVWLHVSCSGLTYRKFKSIRKEPNYIGYCQFCVQEIFPFGKLRNTIFSDITNDINPDNLKRELKKIITTKKFIAKCPFCQKNCCNGSLPCSICNCLIQQKCSKLNLRNFNNLNKYKKLDLSKMLKYVSAISKNQQSRIGQYHCNFNEHK